MTLLPASLEDEELKSVRQEAKNAGYEVRYFTGDILRKNGAVDRAAVDLARKIVWIAADDEHNTVRELWKHEEYHTFPEAQKKKTARQLALKDRKDLKRLVRQYVDLYGWTDIPMRDVLEEILADAYAGINVFDFLDSEEGAKRLSDDVQNVVSKVAGDGVSRGPTSEGTKYSSKAEVLSLKNVDWMADDSSIKQQLQKHTDILNTMDPVAVVDFKSIPTGKLVEKIMYEVSRIGGSFMKRQGITFQFDEEGAKRINAHAKDAELQAAALAAPYVAKYGVLIAGQKNHEGTGLTTLTFAAPAIINEQPVNVGVVIQFQADGSPRAVNVGLQSGKPFKIKKEASKGLDSRVERYVQGTSLPTKDASAFKIAQKTEESNNYYSSRAKTLQKAGNMLAADRGDTSAAQFADRPPDALRHGLRDVYRRGTTDTSRRRPPPTHRVGGGRSRFRIVRPLTPRARA